MSYQVPPTKAPMLKTVFQPRPPPPPDHKLKPKERIDDKPPRENNRTTIIAASVTITALLLLGLLVVIIVTVKKRKKNDMRLRNSKDALDNSCHVDMEEYDDVARNNKQQEANHYEVELDNVYCYAEADQPKEKVPYCDLGKRDDYNHYEEINTVAADDDKTLSDLRQQIEQQKKLLVETHGEKYNESEYEYWAGMMAQKRHSSVYVPPRFEIGKKEAAMIVTNEDAKNEEYLTVLP